MAFHGILVSKIIPTKTQYKTHDGKLLAIVEVLKTWHHDLKYYKHEVFVFTGHNNLYRFVDIKNLSARQVYWAQELLRYHFQINSYQGKTNASVDTFS